jgi:hypothetical protein
LDDLDGTLEARTSGGASATGYDWLEGHARIAVQDGILAYSFSSCFKESIFFGVQTNALRRLALRPIAMVTAALVTVLKPSRSAIVARSKDPVFPDYDCAHTTLHTI